MNSREYLVSQYNLLNSDLNKFFHQKRIRGVMTVLTFMLFYPHCIYSQVTIGKDEAPIYGALLDLKDEGVYADSKQTASRGFGLPRVNLYDKDNLYPMFAIDPNNSIPSPNSDYDNPSKKLQQDEAHIGLVVYNVNQCLNHIGNADGVYVWDGAEWKKMYAPKTGTVTGISGNVYKTASFGNAGEWMIENLAETEYDTDVTGTIEEKLYINQSDNTVQAYYYPVDVTSSYGQHTGVPTHDRRFYDVYRDYGIGLLYTYGGASNNESTETLANNTLSVTSSTVQGICPNGWVLPSDKDWNDLEEVIAKYPALYSTTTTVDWNDAYRTLNTNAGGGLYNRGVFGKSMRAVCKPAGYVGTSVPNGTSKLNGFNIALVGYINTGGAERLYGEFADYWTSSIYDQSNTWGRGVYYSGDGVSRFPQGKSQFQSVRCKKKDN